MSSQGSLDIRCIVIAAIAAIAGKKNFGFVMDRFKKLQSGKISWSSSIREYVRENLNQCGYCGKISALALEHILPCSHGGPDLPDNAICRTCNSSKGHKRLYEWIGLENRYEVPRIAEGKYLKLLYTLHERAGTLNIGDKIEQMILRYEDPSGVVTKESNCE